MLLTDRKYYLRAFLMGILIAQLSLCLSAQIRFSKAYPFGDAVVFNGVCITDSGYMAIARGVDQDYAHPMFVGIYDAIGDQTNLIVYDSEEWYLRSIFDTEVKLNDTTWVLACERWKDDTDTVYCALVWMNQWGDTLFSRQFQSPYYSIENAYSSWVRPAAITKSEDGNSLFVVCQIVGYPQLQNGFIIQQYSSDGVKGWTYQSPIDNNYYACDDIVERNDTIYAIKYGGGGTNYSKIISINALNGNLNWQQEYSDDLFEIYAAHQMIVEQNRIVCCALEFDVNYFRLPMVYAVDFDGNILWKTVAAGDYSQFQNSNHLVGSLDSGYVSCSEQVDYINIPGEESANKIKRIWLWKVDANGVFQWERFYSYYDFDTEYWDMTNIAHDFKATPDGGFICAGEATVACVDYPECTDIIQQGWLLKVDGCGCLVEGCDEACSVGVEEGHEAISEVIFRMGPNPASDLLNVFIPTLTEIDIRKINFQIYDLKGTLIKSFRFQNDNTTYMMDMKSFAAGEYVLSAIYEGRVIKSERVVITK